MLEPWWKQGYQEGVDYAVEKMREKGSRLEFERPDSLFVELGGPLKSFGAYLNVQ